MSRPKITVRLLTAGQREFPTRVLSAGEYALKGLDLSKESWPRRQDYQELSLAIAREPDLLFGPLLDMDKIRPFLNNGTVLSQNLVRTRVILCLIA